MTRGHHHDGGRTRRANLRLAIVLGVIAAGFYVGMLLLMPQQ